MPKQRQRKVSHFRRIKDRSSPIALSNLEVGKIYEFRYMAPDIYDVRPMVFILNRNHRGKYIKGININYLTYYRADQLLQERQNWKQVPAMRLMRKFQWYELYDQAIRTYKKQYVKMIREITYKFRGENKI